MCQSAPDPLDILLRKQPPAVTATFYQKMKFLIEEDSVQSYAHRDEYSERYGKLCLQSFIYMHAYFV